MRKRKIKLKDGEIQTFWMGGKANPCGCGANCFTEQYDGEVLYGVCSSCNSDIYKFKFDQEYIDNSEWKEIK